MKFKLNRVSDSPNHFEHIAIGPFKVSIQASTFSYCNPKITSENSDDYSAFEVAIFKDGKWFHPEADERFSNLVWASYWSPHDDVAGYVPREQIECMLADLNKMFAN